jgi:hypothetical protein
MNLMKLEAQRGFKKRDVYSNDGNAITNGSFENEKY